MPTYYSTEDALDTAYAYHRRERDGDLQDVSPEEAQRIVRELALAAGRMAEVLDRKAAEVERLEARVRGLSWPAQPLVAERMWLGADGGGRRHFLGTKPVSAGTGLFLLTSQGWMPGRYEWDWQDEQGVFYFACPADRSSGVEVSVPILEGMSLAWPAD